VCELQTSIYILTKTYKWTEKCHINFNPAILTADWVNWVNDIYSRSNNNVNIDQIYIVC
jgi:hypothetical protein